VAGAGDRVRDGADVPRRGKGRQPAPRRACGSPGEASQLRADAAPPPVSGAVAEALSRSADSLARRAQRALETVEKVLTK
jgi:hypothetical protein